MNAHQRRAAKRRTKLVDNEIVLQGTGCVLAISVNSPGGQLFGEQGVIDLMQKRATPFPRVSVRFTEPTHFTIEGQRQQRGKSMAESIRERLVELATRDAGPAMVLDLATGKAEFIERPSAEVLMLREQLKRLEVPVNPKTGVPYFEVRSAGWGEGWTAEKIVKDEGFTFLDTDFKKKD